MIVVVVVVVIVIVMMVRLFDLFDFVLALSLFNLKKKISLYILFEK